jgi:hypothetical protein
MATSHHFSQSYAWDSISLLWSLALENILTSIRILSKQYKNFLLVLISQFIRERLETSLETLTSDWSVWGLVLHSPNQMHRIVGWSPVSVLCSWVQVNLIKLVQDTFGRLFWVQSSKFIRYSLNWISSTCTIKVMLLGEQKHIKHTNTPNQ